MSVSVTTILQIVGYIHPDAIPPRVELVESPQLTALSSIHQVVDELNDHFGRRALQVIETDTVYNAGDWGAYREVAVENASGLHVITLRPTIRLAHDGRVVMGENYTPDEVRTKIIRALEMLYLKLVIQPAMR